MHGLAVHRVAAEEFVRPFAREHHLHIPAGVLGQEVQRHLGGVGHGFVQIPLDHPVGFEELVGVHRVGDAGHPDLPAECLGVGQFGVLFLGIAHREALHMGGALGHLVDHEAGIHAGGEEAAHLHVGDLVGGHALGKGVGDALLPLRLGGGLVDVVADVVVAVDLHLAVVPGEPVRAGQLVDVFEHRLVIRDVLDAQVLGQAASLSDLWKPGWARKLLISLPKRNRPSTL